MCDNIKEQIINNGQYNTHCSQEETPIEKSDLDDVIKQAFDYDHCSNASTTQCFSNKSCNHLNEMCGKDYKEHFSKHSDESNIKCDPRENTVENKNLTSHMGNVYTIDGKFECEVCLKSFAADVLLKQHVLSHSNKRLFNSNQGELCEQEFTNYNLQGHMAEHSDQNPVKCDKRFETKQKLTTHTKKVRENGKSFQCQICAKSFAWTCELKRHMISHSDKRSLECDQCSRTFKTQYVLVSHKARMHSIGGKFSCDICGKLFISLSYLKKHITRHTNETEINCDKCNNRFTSQRRLIAHMKIVHATVKSFQCQICPKSFAVASYLRAHVAYHDEKTRFQCDQCPKTFQTQHVLDSHKAQVHSIGGNFSCGICGKLFVIISQLKKHMTKHSNEKNFNCDKCNKNFKSQGQLTTHMKIVHATEKSFHCQICPKSYVRAYDLKKHTVSHNEKRSFKCDQCPKTFKTQYVLDGHKALTHNGDGKFSCAVCGKLFINLSHLKRHIIKHNNERNYNCDKCNKKFKSQRYVAIHMKTAHATEKSFQFEMVDVKVEPSVLYDPEMQQNIQDVHLDVKDEIEDMAITEVDIKKEPEDTDN